VAGTALAAMAAAPALGQDHSSHGGHAAPAPAPGAGHAQTEHAPMEHGHRDHGAEAGRTHAGHGQPQGRVEASGTSVLPQAEGMMPGAHFDLGGGWAGMAHGHLWGVYTDQGGPRGDDKLYVQSMAMLMAAKAFGGARLQLRTMLSAEPLMDARGYPNLFATGETARGVPLVDRQHPHD